MPTRRATNSASASSRSRSTFWRIERTGSFKGRYHVLHGAISPMDGIGPDRLKVRELLERAAARCRDGEPYEEVVLATNPTLEGEATAMYLAERLADDVRLDNKDRARDPGRGRPRVRRRGDARARHAGPAGVRGQSDEGQT